MIITIVGKAGSGKSVVAKRLAKKLKMKHYSSGDFFRELARKKKMGFIELNKYAKTHASVDKYVDNRQKRLGKEKDNFVMDGRTSAFFIPHSVKIFLDVSLDKGAGRIFKHKRKFELYKSVNQAKKFIKKRIKLEKQRYRKYYKLDPYQRKHYDLYLNTSNLTINQVVNKIIKFVKKL